VIAKLTYIIQSKTTRNKATRKPQQDNPQRRKGSNKTTRKDAKEATRQTAKTQKMTSQMTKDISVAREYFEKIFGIITDFLRYRTLVGKGSDENLTVATKSEELWELAELLSKENEKVRDGFRELVVLEFKEYIFNYENCREEDIQHNLDYSVQYDHIIRYFGFDDYYERHIYDPKHFMMTPESIYDFAS
jgi:hypothetical protein